MEVENAGQMVNRKNFLDFRGESSGNMANPIKNGGFYGKIIYTYNTFHSVGKSMGNP